MKVRTLLIVLILCASVSLIGCDQGMTQPITKIITLPDAEIVTPTQSSSEKAQAAIEKINGRRTEVHQMAEETGDFSMVFTASEDIFREELGFRKGFWVDLVEIYRQENLENPELLQGLENLEDAFVEKLKADTFGMFYFEYIRTFDALIVEYLRLSYEFPEKNEDELFALFRESVRTGEIAIIFP